jgi:uncharacterized Zn-binding protein involved in type VI secretion
MGAPAVVAGDQITGVCAIHQIPSPVGAPMPGPPMPFAAPLTVGLAATVLIAGKPAAVQGSSGFCTPPHVGLHASDPCMVPTMQQGQVLVGSTTVLIASKPAAYTGCSVSQCMNIPSQVAGTAATVLIGS